MRKDTLRGSIKAVYIVHVSLLDATLLLFYLLVQIGGLQI